jgi:hypothetical protein
MHPDHIKAKIPLDQCVWRRVYKIHCRNLRFGVFDGTKSFIGIRTKFGQRYLDEEEHWDAGPPYGTVSGHIDMGFSVPPEALDAYDRRDPVALLAFLEGVEQEHKWDSKEFV